MCNNLCINTYTPQVAATSFFAGEVEIFDFVTERAKRCIAAKRENWREGLENLLIANEHTCAIKNRVYGASHQNIHTNKVIVSVKYSIYVIRAGTYSN